MTTSRPNPDALLKQLTEEERLAKRGKLTIFFGAAPGVGKTYAMLEAARRDLEEEKRDVVAGIVETHGRYDTASLLLGLEILPRRTLEHRGVSLSELDIDAAIARRPSLLLVDELAHTNAPGSRHAKRWQDVEEILDAGIDVYSTLNVQHVESLNDVVAQITGVIVRETVPDTFIERATDLRLVDLPPEQLLERLKEGKVYLPAQASLAANHFFQKGNLIALRELALRQTADRVDADMRRWKDTHGIEKTWAASERILVGVSASPLSARLLRSARRMTGSLHAPWIALYVETSASLRLSTRDRERLSQNLRLAQQLGAETVTLTGENAAEETIRYARARNVTKIVVGKPTHPRWKDLLRPSFLDQVVRESGEIDVYVISGETASPAGKPRIAPKAVSNAGEYFASFAVIAAASLFSWVVFGRRELPDVVMVLLLGIVLVSMRFGFGPSIVAAVLGVLSFDFFFVPPYFTFRVSDLRHVLTFGIMFLVAIVISSLTQRIRAQANASRERENRTASLYAMSRELTAAATNEELLAVAVRHLSAVFQAKVAILTESEDGRLRSHAQGEFSFSPSDKEEGVAEWVWKHERPAGLSTDTLPSSSAFYTLLRAGEKKIGVLGLAPNERSGVVGADQRELLETFASQIATAISRADFAASAQKAQLQVETEQLRNSLLSSVSHDLRTPLAIITGSAAAVAEQGLPEATRKELLVTIQEEGDRLNRLVRNLLDMTRLEAGALRVRKELQPIEEVIGAALTRLEERLRDRVVSTRISSDLPMVPLDAVLIEQVFINLLENALKYTPPGSPIDIDARLHGSMLEVNVSDRGPGIAQGDIEKVFDKFYRGEVSKGGVGLGLTICRGIVVAHGGRLWSEPRDGGGATFRFTLPIEGTQ